MGLRVWGLGFRLEVHPPTPLSTHPASHPVSTGVEVLVSTGVGVGACAVSVGVASTTSTGVAAPGGAVSWCRR